MSVVGLGASPQMSDAIVNPLTPTMKSRLRPKMSPSRPPVISSTA